MSSDNTNTTDEQDNDDNYTGEIITPGAEKTKVDSVNGSPLERMKQDLPDKLHRNFTAAGNDHPLVETAGSKEALLSDTPVNVQKILTDDLYEETSVFFREWKQNHIAAVVREAKRRIVNAYGEDALFYEFQHDHEELDGTNTIRLPKDAPTLLSEARDLGYLPTIEFEVNHDEQKLITRDNGIAMTTGEVIDLWNEPAESGSGADLSSAGNKGIGSLTWVTIAGDEGAMLAQTRTKREQLLSGEAVPARDQGGFKFFSFFGGVVPVTGDTPDGFFGTRFEIPIKSDLDATRFKDQMKQYTDVLPVQITWNEVDDGVTHDDEFEKQTFLDRYEEEPSIVIDRPGEFTIALGDGETVSGKAGADDTYLLDNPISRNAPYRLSLNTLWNDHIQIHNEQGLIVAGPNRGKLNSEVDELHGDISDIADDDAPMPDVPLPEPVASRDNLKNDGALERFLKYANEIAIERELTTVYEYINAVLDADSQEGVIEVVRERGAEFSLYRDLTRQHAGYSKVSTPDSLFDWLDAKDAIDFDGQAIPLDGVTDDDIAGDNTVDDARQKLGIGTMHKWVKVLHPKWDLLVMLTKLDNEVDLAHKDTRGDPNLKENRENSARLGEIIGDRGLWPIYVGATLNEHRTKVLFNPDNEPDAALIKTRRYGKWESPPWHANLLKNVPFKRGADEADEWTIPDSIHEQHAASSTSSSDDDTDENGLDLTDPDNFQERRVQVRCQENAAIDVRTTVGDLMEELDDTDFGHTISGLQQPWVVLFPSTHDENISDYYWLSEHAAIIKCINREAEALHRYPQVFYVDEFEAMLSDYTFRGYDPFAEEFITARASDIPDQNENVYFFDPYSNDELHNALFGHTINGVAPDDDVYEQYREVVVGAFTESGHIHHTDTNPITADDPAESEQWVVYWWPTKTTTGQRLGSYYSGFSHFVPEIFGRRNTPTGTERQTFNYGNRLERGKHPTWDHDSQSWMNVEGRSYSKEVTGIEEQLLLACRDLGIDPYEDHERDDGRLRQALVMMADTCPDGDA